MRWWGDPRPTEERIPPQVVEHLPKGLHPQDLHSALNVTYRRTTLVGFDIERTVRLTGDPARIDAARKRAARARTVRAV